jgi:acetolactate synthase-1/2/3 large subunit
MEKIEGGRLVVEAFKKEGIKHLFSLCGSSINPIYDACLDAGIKIIDTRHESAAVYMADVWSRITGEPGVSAVTSGPGHTNSLTGIAIAWKAHSRVIAISGNYETVDGPDRSHETDHQMVKIDNRCGQYSEIYDDRVPAGYV